MSFWKTFREVMGKKEVFKQTLLPRKQDFDGNNGFVTHILVNEQDVYWKEIIPKQIIRSEQELKKHFDELKNVTKK